MTARRLSRFAFLLLTLAVGTGNPSRAMPPPGKAALTYPETDYIERLPGRPGGTLRTSASYESGSFDIHTIHPGNMLWEARLIYDNLVYLDTAGEPSPWLAKSWTISPDGKTYTFLLRDDVSFSDGTRFDAEAVKTNFERIKKLGLGSRIAAAYLAPVVEAVALDTFTFEVHLNAPYHPFLHYLAQSWLGLISPRQIRQNPDSIKDRPIGSGPFVVREYTPGKRAVFQRRADYAWAPAALHHTGPAYLETVILEAIPNENERAAALLDGRFELTFEAPLEHLSELQADPNLVYSNRVRPGSPMRSLAFNTRRVPFDDVRVRRAIAIAINRNEIVRQMSSKTFSPKTDFLSANTPDYDGGFRDALAYDPPRAEALLDSAGWSERGADGIRMKAGQRLSAELLTTGDERTPPSSVLAIQSDLRKIGFELRLTFVTSPRLNERVRSGNYDVLTGGWWTATTPDVLYLLYHSSQISRQNTFGQDTGNLADPKLDDLLLRARQSLDLDERHVLYREIQRLLTELVPVVPLHDSHHVIVYRRELHGLLFETVHNTPLLTAAWLDNSSR